MAAAKDGSKAIPPSPSLGPVIPAVPTSDSAAASPLDLAASTEAASSPLPGQPNLDPPRPLGFYEVFDEDAFIRCSPLHGKNLRRVLVGTQMFTQLVEERYEINVRRLAIESGADRFRCVTA